MKETALPCTDLLTSAQALAPRLSALRRTLHRAPELGGDTAQTQHLIRRTLTQLGVTLPEVPPQAGVIGLIHGSHPGPCILLRADMDALPIQEQSGADYASQVPGVMHACGHDAHVAWLLGAAQLLMERRDQLAGTVKLAFQPCEESTAGPGVREMIAAGDLENPQVDMAIAAHVSPQLPAGTVGVSAGPVTGATGPFQVRVYGQGGHDSGPSRCTDPILVLNQIYTAFQTIQRVTLPPDRPAVISVGRFRAGEAGNVIPDQAEMAGSIRTGWDEDNLLLAGRMEEIARQIASAYGARAEFQHILAVGACINDQAAAARVAHAAISLLGRDQVVAPPLNMAGDDFARFAARVPICYFFVGCGNDARGMVHPLHSSCFDLDERCVPLAAAVLAQAALGSMTNVPGI